MMLYWSYDLEQNGKISKVFQGYASLNQKSDPYCHYEEAEPEKALMFIGKFFFQK